MEKVQKPLTIFTAISLFFLLYYSLVGIFAFPSVDDFQYAIKAWEHGFWQAQVNEYFNWNGRYIATALLTFNPITWRMNELYHLIPFLLILGLVGSSYYFLTSFLNTISTKKAMLSYAACLTFIFLLRHWAINQGIYWLAGSMTYTFPLIIFFISLGWVFNYFSTTSKALKFIYILLAICGSFILIGCNETLMVTWDYTLFMFLVYRYFFHKEFNKPLFILLLFSITFSLIVLLAPGNSVRASRHEKSHQIIRTIGNSLVYMILYSIKFLIPTYLIFLVFTKNTIKKIQKKYSVFHPSKEMLFFILTFTAGIMFLMNAPSLWGMGRRPNDRTLSSTIFIYYFLFPVLAAQIYYNSKTKYKKLIDKITNLPIKTYYIILVLSLFTFNNYYLLKDTFFNFSPYRKFIIQRENQIKYNQNDIIELEAYPYAKRPKTTVFKDIDTYTPSYAEYLGKKKVIITNLKELK